MRTDYTMNHEREDREGHSANHTFALVLRNRQQAKVSKHVRRKQSLASQCSSEAVFKYSGIVQYISQDSLELIEYTHTYRWFLEWLTNYGPTISTMAVSLWVESSKIQLIVQSPRSDVSAGLQYPLESQRNRF